MARRKPNTVSFAAGRQRRLNGVQGDYQYGFRVPLIVVSAFTPKGYINNVKPQDFGTILRFIQNVFGLGEGSLGFADARANGDLRAFFSFNASPRVFNTIMAPLDANMRISLSTILGPVYIRYSGRDSQSPKTLIQG
jgi:phospholipase C